MAAEYGWLDMTDDEYQSLVSIASGIGTMLQFPTIRRKKAEEKLTDLTRCTDIDLLTCEGVIFGKIGACLLSSEVLSMRSFLA